MRDITLSDKNILIYRIIFAGLSWFIILSGIFTSGSVLNWLEGFKSFTMQTNLMVTIWFTLAIIWHNKPENIKKMKGILKGAFTLYITITFIFFAVLLSGLYKPTELFPAFRNLVVHYITPIAFIIDWVLTEDKGRYQWSYLPYWIIYPIGYLVFAFIHGTITGSYLYYFLNVSKIGYLMYALVVSGLIGVGLVIGCIYIWINKRWTIS
ncbi:MAG: Pr6Pr family membrane protein [Promethearchaeota archaeon]|jgi:hypothetical protein